MLAETLTILRGAYPRAEFPDESAGIYLEALGDLDDDELAEACRRLINRQTFLPSIAEIRLEVAEARLGLPTPAEAWDLVWQGKAKDAPEPVRLAYEATGGAWGIRTTTNVGMTRHQFESDYASRREAALYTEVGARAPLRVALPPADESPVAALGMGIQEAAEAQEYVEEHGEPTPVLLRSLARRAGRELDPPTEEERRDAVRILRAGSSTENPAGDPVYVEAERVLMEAGS